MIRKRATVYVIVFLLKCTFLCMLFQPSVLSLPTNSPSFSIDYDNNTFLKDGQPFRYISGSIHYFRIPHEYWEDRLRKMKYAGLNAIQVYVAWNVHEPEPGVYDFDGQQDLVKFIKLAQQVGLVVILRPGPYICAEWEFGGFPYWLIRDNPSVVLRSHDPQYIAPVKRWLDVLLPKMKPLLYINGGAIITVQVENEYGSYFTCDRNYTHFLRDYFISHLGSKVVLFTTDGDGASFLKCGVIDGVYSTVDFGPGNATSAFSVQRTVEPKGPLVNSEYYVGWLDHWGQPHSVTSWQTAVKTLDDMLALGANVNMYMFIGGTNFGYMNGADYFTHNSSYLPIPSSYDYNAPLSEAGDMTSKYEHLKLTISKYTKQTSVSSSEAGSAVRDPKPTNTSKKAYGSVKLHPSATVLEYLPFMSGKPVESTFPLTMEKLNQSYGYTLYRTELKHDCDNVVLNAPGVKDRAYVFVKEVMISVLSRTGSQSTTISGRHGDTLDIIVENQGRINYGSMLMNNSKGLTENVTLDHGVVTDWKMYSLNLSLATSLKKITGPSSHPISPNAQCVPTIYQGSLDVDEVADTFLSTEGWTKGVVFINGFNLGRYWPVMGPQITLYVPAPVLTLEDNIVTVVEFEGCPPKDNTVNFVDKPVLNNKTVEVEGGRPITGTSARKYHVVHDVVETRNPTEQPRKTDTFIGRLILILRAIITTFCPVLGAFQP